ncbi:unnamed protein product [Didymodactylos carnosus]|uniref:Uncharacterized protein n=1 Tax=Didymodactylos carnosus TaxID=1234261 RepID=A0A8S2HQU6_9BILA|nr:unnamed protein product [Didymodactylos carnosus]CAF3674225.1 unnamed protein product [Didymodactylos carnosus]
MPTDLDTSDTKLTTTSTATNTPITPMNGEEMTPSSVMFTPETPNLTNYADDGRALTPSIILRNCEEEYAVLNHLTLNIKIFAKVNLTSVPLSAPAPLTNLTRITTTWAIG